jgi:Spy/CpxP family protein refolding chaperone
MNLLTRKAALFYLLATFAVGSAAGLAVGYSVDRRPKPPKFDPTAFKQKITADLSRDLSLTEAQRKQLEPIIERNMEEFDGCRRENTERVRQSMQRGRERIAAILTPEQRAKFEELERERERKFRERDSHGGSRSAGK